MKRVVVEIDACMECPAVFEDAMGQWRCGRFKNCGGGCREIPDIGVIPKWCELPEVKE